MRREDRERYSNRRESDPGLSVYGGDRSRRLSRTCGVLGESLEA